MTVLAVGAARARALVAAARAAMQSPDNELWRSPISVWEALALAERGRLTISATAAERVQRMVRAIARREAPLTHDIAGMSRQLVLSHQDPADRFLAATALVMGLTLVTADEQLLQLTEYAVLADT